MSTLHPPCAERPGWQRWLIRQTLIIIAISTAMSLVQLPLTRSPWQGVVLYTVCITICCSVFVQSLSQLFTFARNRRRPPHEAQTWPGPLLMGISLVVGTLLGISVGGQLGAMLSGSEAARVVPSSAGGALAMLAFSLMPGIALTSYFVARQRVERANAAAQMAQRVAAETQLRLLEAQLEPHMLFNTLANLRVLISLDPPRAQAMLDHLIAFLRATLTASRSESHSLAREFERLQDYLALMQVRMGERLRCQLQLPAALADHECPPLLLQPLVENAIKHGLEPKPGGGELHIEAVREGQVLLLRVQDSGAGLSDTPSADGTHFGLQQIRERLQTRYGEAASLRLFAPEAGGCCAEIRLPLAA